MRACIYINKYMRGGFVFLMEAKFLKRPRYNGAGCCFRKRRFFLVFLLFGGFFFYSASQSSSKEVCVRVRRSAFVFVCARHGVCVCVRVCAYVCVMNTLYLRLRSDRWKVSAGHTHTHTIATAETCDLSILALRLHTTRYWDFDSGCVSTVL